jgi:hypothetical protein
MTYVCTYVGINQGRSEVFFFLPKNEGRAVQYQIVAQRFQRMYIHVIEWLGAFVIVVHLRRRIHVI